MDMSQMSKHKKVSDKTGANHGKLYKIIKMQPKK